MSRLNQREVSIFELYSLTHKFIRYELMHAGIAVGVFSILFLVLKPWDSTYYYEGAHPFWFVGPPLVYFILDLFFAMLLLFALKTELQPRRCIMWVTLQVANLILLTIMGFYMVWNYYYRGNTYLRLTFALIILYCYKAYRISKMHKLIILMRNHCAAQFNTTPMSEIPQPNSVSDFKSPYVIPTPQISSGFVPNAYGASSPIPQEKF